MLDPAHFAGMINIIKHHEYGLLDMMRFVLFTWSL